MKYIQNFSWKTFKKNNFIFEPYVQIGEIKTYTNISNRNRE